MLTGANSFVGNSFIKKFNKSYHFSCLVRPNSKRTNYANFKYYDIDFLNPVFNKNMFKNIFAVIHILSIKSSYHSDIFKINVDFTKKLVEAAILNKVQKFIYISSETVQLPGVDRYTESKKQAEKEIHIHKNNLILRPTVIYGKKNTSDIGLLIELSKRMPVVPIIGSGKQLIQPISVEDFIKCIDSGLRNDISGVHLIAGQKSLSYREIINIIAKALNKKIIVINCSILLSYLIAKLFLLLRINFLQKSQVDNLKVNREYSIDNAEKIFYLKFTDPKEGICKVIK